MSKMLSAASKSRMTNFNDKLVQQMLFEMNNKIRNGAYGFISRTMAYNSNRIEGSRLSEDQTYNLFETGCVYGTEIYHSKDIEEMEGHFLMFNEMLNTIKSELSIDMIKAFHKDLVQCVFEYNANGYVIGDWKKKKNVVGTMETTLPENVDKEMHKLVDRYLSRSEIRIGDIVEFHAEYERIHPFQDGNGRTGRIIMFRECLRNNITPFIIRDENKAKYLDCLKSAHHGFHVPFIEYITEEQMWFYDKVVGFL